MSKYKSRKVKDRHLITAAVIDVIIGLVIILSTQNWFYLLCFYAYSRMHYRFDLCKNRQLEILEEIEKIKNALEIEDLEIDDFDEDD